VKQLPPSSRDVFLAPHEVDPEFTGTAIEFVDKYGHIQTETAAQRATGRLTAWRQNIAFLAKQVDKLPDWPKVDHNWLRQPRPGDVAKLAEALAILRPKIDEAEALLRRAEAALLAEQNPTGASHSPPSTVNGGDLL